MEIPFIGGSYMGRSKNINSQRCINLYPIVDNYGGKSVVAVHGTPGLTEFCNPGLVEEVRNIHPIGNYLYAVIGNTLYKISPAGAYTAISGNLSKSTDFVWMADNGVELFIVEPGIEGYIYETVAGGNLTAIVDADFPTPDSVVFLDGYFIVTETNTGKFWICTLYDGTAWDALDYATAEQHMDNLLAAAVTRGQLILIGGESIEAWANTGAADFPFENIPGTTALQGIGAAASIATDGNSLFFLNNRNQIVTNSGYNIAPISTPSIDYRISTYPMTSDARGYCYHQEGHSFYVLVFPSGDTWAYDITTGFFHERQSFTLKDADGATIENYTGRHRGNCYADFGGKHLVGDYENGKIYEMDLDVYTDDSNTIRAVRTAQVIYQERKRMFFPSCEIDFEAGVGLAIGPDELEDADYNLVIHSDTTDGSTTFTDSGGHEHTITEVQGDGSVQHDTAQKKIGASSMLFDGTDGTLSCANHDDWNFGSGAIRIEFWVRFNALPTAGGPASGIFEQNVDTEHRHVISIVNIGGVYSLSWVCRNDNGGTNYIINKLFGPITIVADTWYRFALIRGWDDVLNTWAVTMNNQLIDTVSQSGDMPNLAASFIIGLTDGSYLDGWLDEIKILKGEALSTLGGTNPKAMLDWSDDGGHTWSNELWRSIGKIGDYDARAKWNRLGSSRNRIFRVTISDPVKKVIMGAYAPIIIGDN